MCINSCVPKELPIPPTLVEFLTSVYRKRKKNKLHVGLLAVFVTPYRLTPEDLGLGCVNNNCPWSVMQQQQHKDTDAVATAPARYANE